jgi:hypothetical protein
MSTLDISKNRAEQFDNLEGKSIEILQEYLEGRRAGGDDIKIAIQAANVVAKNRVTTTARDALKFSMVKSITDEPKVLKKYVNATQPEVKKLMG